jgi:hypothetical protein
MWKDPKVQGSAALFAVFFIAASILAYNVPAMQSQYYTFIFMGLGAMYSIMLVMVKPDGGNKSVPPPPDTSDKQVSLSQPTN